MPRGKRRMRNQAAFVKYPRFFKPFDQFLFQWEPAAQDRGGFLVRHCAL
jgi:hypothetical protein